MNIKKLLIVIIIGLSGYSYGADNNDDNEVVNNNVQNDITRAFFKAIDSKEYDEVQKLIDAGVSVNSFFNGINDLTALTLACHNRDIKMVQYY